MIKKAVIPAAGFGTRFLPATKSMPKEMLPIIDKPVIQYVVEEAVSSGIDDILIITGRGKRAIEDYFDTSPELESHLSNKNNIGLLEEIREISNLADLHYIRQKQPRGLGDAILKAEKHIGDAPFAVLLGDDIIVSETPAIKQLADFSEQNGASVVGVERISSEHAGKYGVVGVVDGLVTEMIEKPLHTRYDLAAIGRYILKPTIFDYIKETQPGHGGEIQLTDALNSMLVEERIYVREISGTRYDIGDKLGYVKAVVDFALNKEDLANDLREHLKRMIH